MIECNYVIFRLFLLVNLLMTACSVHTFSNQNKNKISSKCYNHQQSVSTITHYQTYGTFTYISKDKKFYARFNWQQTSTDCYRLIITNPLGNTEMDLSVQPSIVQIINNQGKRYISSNDPEVIFQKLFSIYIPINDLRQWILGLLNNAIDFSFNINGYLYQVNYSRNGQYWIVTYHSYHEDIVPALPSNLELRQGDHCIKLKIDSWKL